MQRIKSILMAMLIILVFISPPLIAQEQPMKASIEGSAFSFENNEAIAGIILLLCDVTQEGACNVNPNYLATTDNNGIFNFHDVPYGKYLVLYYEPNLNNINKDSIKKSPIIYSLGDSAKHAYTIFNTSFGGGQGITVKKGTKFSIIDGERNIAEGSFISEAYRFSIDFYDGTPQIIEVNDPELSNIEIKIWL